MRTLFRFTLVLLLTVLVNNAFSQNRFNPNFKYKIKGEKSEYNAKDVYDGTKKRGIDISNIKNTYGTDRYPEHVEDHGGGKCSKEEFIQIFKIFRDAIGHKNYKKLLCTSDVVAIYVVYYPGGKPFEVRFSLRGDTIDKISMDYFNVIEEEIKRNHTVQKLKSITDRYTSIRYEYSFDNLDKRQFDSEIVQLSKVE
ncbi:MAG: hypothetical protein A2X19_02470 [Bacteroidetes bacterium GWE2_39_28]|nr:MAG: hypothetical protein A2X19_02470 [Bacteroidetes bacterium GWE2_39_28]OFY11854.1 MAG: hypothetical protein A2X16_05935 [Bacteroidetes bacterium GWF2_39_10]OFZ08474.1 MAG: hypothetical protein A2322_05910 [Bacteroidetes bacterium RIFOXYB2_FULL_39_7]OFZ11341.1 MAG: hypothetical protein A2465_09450 [Bacteroidetes bacterium RIFOXYC2_FULL_39_11]HCT95201.1 hypothetical protein [Rikenellaceae bacterium]